MLTNREKRKEGMDVREETIRGRQERELDWNLRSLLKCKNVTKCTYKDKQPVKKEDKKRVYITLC